MNLKALTEIAPFEWPEDAGERILEALHNRTEAADRSLAVELASEYVVMNDEIALELLSILDSAEESEELRCDAALSLGPIMEHTDVIGFDDPEEPLSEPTFTRLGDRLRQIYHDSAISEEIRRRVLETSARAPQDWHHDAVRAAFANKDEEWRHTALICSRYIAGFEQEILEALGSGDPACEYEAVCAAGNWEIDAAWPRVSAWAVDDAIDRDLRLAAIEALASIRPQESASILIDLSISKDEEIAEAAIEALALSGGFPDPDEGLEKRLGQRRALQSAWPAAESFRSRS